MILLPDIGAALFRRVTANDRVTATPGRRNALLESVSETAAGSKMKKWNGLVRHLR